MESDPTPYIALAYGAGLLLLGGYALWTVVARHRLRQLARAMHLKEGG